MRKNKLIVSTFLLLIALLGSVLSWIMVNTFIVKISLWQFICIELIISFGHSFYNKAKSEFNYIK